MGREIRRVPPKWEHPKDEGGRYIPLLDEPFEDVAAQWKESFASWERGERPDYCSVDNENLEFWEWEGNPPDRSSYRPKWTEEPTWFQVYETVSEGTPVTPPFATEEELTDYLVENGDFWCQRRGESPPSREAVTAFIEGGWAPSMMVIRGSAGVTIRAGIDAARR